MDRKLLNRVEAQAWFHRFPRGVPIFLFILTLAVTILAIASVERADKNERRLVLERNASELASALQRRAAENIAYLTAASSIIADHDDMTNREFRAFTKELNEGHALRGALGMGWAPAVRNADLPAFYAQLHEHQDDDEGTWAIRPEPQPDQKLHVVIATIEPLEQGNRNALGYDMYSDPTRRKAMDEAVRTGRPSVSGRVHLVQDAGDPGAPGFLIYVPVFDGARRDRLRGFVYSPVRVKDFIGSGLNSLSDRKLSVSVYDGAVSIRTLMGAYGDVSRGGESYERPVTIGDRTWWIRLEDSKPLGLTQLSIVILLFGLAMAAILSGGARYIMRRAAEDRQVLEWLSRQSAIRTSLTRELNHRVKNTLANVLSIVSLTKRGMTDVNEFAESLSGRVRALSATHDILSQREWNNAPVEEIVRSELAPYMDENDNHIEMSGPHVDLAPNEALSLGLALHELATNAAKYGALGVPSGRVRVNWHLVEPDVLQFDWQESGGPEVQPPSRRGFGLDLIEKIVAGELQNAVSMRFDPSGVGCTIRVPVRKRTDFEFRTRQNA